MILALTVERSTVAIISRESRTQIRSSHLEGAGATAPPNDGLGEGTHPSSLAKHAGAVERGASARRDPHRTAAPNASTERQVYA